MLELDLERYPGPEQYSSDVIGCYTTATNLLTSLKEKYDYIMSGPEKNSLDPMDQTPLTRFIKVFDLKDEAIVFQNTVNGVLDTVNGFIGDDNGVDAASDKLDSIPAYGGTVSSVPTGILSSVMKIPDYVGKAAAAAFKFIRYKFW